MAHELSTKSTLMDASLAGPLGVVVLKEGREKTLKLGHPWIFSKGIERFSGVNGQLVEVFSYKREHLGIGYVNTKSNIRLRMLGFLETQRENLLERLIKNSIKKRENLQINSNALRLVNGENDGLCGLIVDLYDRTAVVQFGTLGMELLKDEVVQALKNSLDIKAIYEKSTSISRKEEGLLPQKGWLTEEKSEQPIEIFEHDVRFLVDVVHGQKTGFFLDQREMRFYLRSYVKDKKVLNLCAYSGGFSLHALKAKALKVVSVDISGEACRQMQENTDLNGLENHEIIESDVFSFLQNTTEMFDVVIVDPPAFIKSKKDTSKGVRAYRELNRMALRRVQPGGVLMTSSCSYNLEESLFDTILLEASLMEKREVKLVQRHLMAPDHLKNIAFREGEYLKTVVLLC
ncbi:MAG: class I SAM-dependent rRNA methyltransferase [Chlamydiae bacterium]|nr:class I SAM-dependent rRNA methyltransferase [Chlamydiota bacterium]